MLVGDCDLAEGFWESLKNHRKGDPIRLALLAAQTSMRCAEAVHIERVDGAVGGGGTADGAMGGGAIGGGGAKSGDNMP